MDSTGEEQPKCAITIDLAGPPTNKVRSKTVASITLREMATEVLEKCVERAGWAGFGTYGIWKTGSDMYSHLKESARGDIGELASPLCRSPSFSFPSFFIPVLHGISARQGG